MIHTRTLAEARTVGEVAEIFRVSTKTIRRWREAGRLPGAYRVGRELRFPTSVVERLAADMAEGEARPAA